jgi:hypothetical protein
MATKNISSDIKKQAKMAAKIEEEVDECNICCVAYNKSTHLPIECEQAGCKYKACLECIRTYLLTSMNEPHCMECKTNWSAKFMLHLRKGWLSDVYRPHREKLLCDIELSKIAETMPDAERYKAYKKQEGITEELRKQYFAMKLELEKMQTKINESARLTHHIKHGTEGAKKEEKKEFFMPCPALACNGMLSTQYKCAICEQFACQDCHEVIGLSKTVNEHTCDPNNVASALAIKKETKQCPGCHNRIYRVEGCSQMWCTGCHTAFDWVTGRKVVSERLHNPHWIEYQRGLNGGTAPRAPGDVPCGGICSRHQLNMSIVGKLNRLKHIMSGGTINLQPSVVDITMSTIRTIHTIVENISLNDVREIRERVQSLRDFKTQRVKYIVGEWTKEQISSHIYRSDIERQKNTELLNVYELLSAVGIDMFNIVLSNTTEGEIFLAELIEQIEQYNKLRIYCNGLFAVISNTYNKTVPQITENWVRISHKFNSRTLKKIEAQVNAAGAPVPEAIIIS